MSALPIIEDRIRPFHCGTQHADWECCNCDRCTKNTPHELGMPTCEVQRAICEAAFGDGSVSREMAFRMGVNEETRLAYLWPCAEVEWTPEWIAEHKRRQTFRYRFAKWRHDTRRRVRDGVGEWWRNLRMKWRMPIAERRAKNPQACHADWILWAIGHHDEKPSRDNGGSCRDESREVGSCWCGKFQNGEPAGGSR